MLNTFLPILHDGTIFKVVCVSGHTWGGEGLREGSRNLGEVCARACTLISATAEGSKHRSPFSSCGVTKAKGQDVEAA